MKTTSSTSPSLYIFANDLRINDNPLLNQAITQSAADNTDLVCLYCLQAWQFKPTGSLPAAMGTQRYAFLWQSLQALRHQLRRHGVTMIIQLGTMQNVVLKLHTNHRFKHIYHSQSAGFYERTAYLSLRDNMPEVMLHTDHITSLFKPNQLPFEISDLPKNFTPFRKQVAHLATQAPIITSTESVHLNMTARFNADDQWPQLPEASADIMTSDFMGGESAALAHCHEYFSGTAPSNYKSVRNQLMGWQNSTKFSPWLALGCLSPRQIMQDLSAYEAAHGANESTYWIYFELLWREFFYWNAIKQGAQLFMSKSGFDQPLHDMDLPQAFTHWTQGQIGEPLINACMRELNHTGYLSNRGRQIAASYLINELGVDWRLGAGYFERMLIDYDVASNWGNWQYIAGVGADPRGGRHFNIEKQQKTHDPKGQYIQQWAEVKSTHQNIYWHDLV